MVSRFLLITLSLTVAALPMYGQANPGRMDAMQNYRTGRDLESRGNIQDAGAYYMEAVRICSDEIGRKTATRDSYTILTWALQRQQKYSEVVSWGRQALSLFPDEYRVMETLGEAYFYLNDFDNSLKFMQGYANAQPEGERIAVAYFFVGEIFRIQRKFRHADIAYTTAVRLEPSPALWWYRLGTVREAAGDNAQAVEAYERALRINPSYRQALDGLARIRDQA
jgi:tetratricopeptide (TPR) repeat protein